MPRINSFPDFCPSLNFQPVEFHTCAEIVFHSALSRFVRLTPSRRQHSSNISHFSARIPAFFFASVTPAVGPVCTSTSCAPAETFSVLPSERAPVWVKFCTERLIIQAVYSLTRVSRLDVAARGGGPSRLPWHRLIVFSLIKTPVLMTRHVVSGGRRIRIFKCR